MPDCIPRSVLGCHVQPAVHPRMEAADVGHDAGSPQAVRPVALAGRSISKLPSVALAVWRKMSTFVHSKMSFTDPGARAQKPACRFRLYKLARLGAQRGWC